MLKRLCNNAHAGTIVVVSLFLIISAAAVAGSFSQALEESIGSDTAITISRAVADLSPSLYASDFLFSNPQNYAFYNNATVLLFKGLVWFGSSPVGWEYRIVAASVIFAFLFGWFRLAMFYTGSNLASLIFSVVAAVAVAATPGDYWGIHSEPQARVQFSALLPYILLSAAGAGIEMKRWLLTFLLAGIGMWLHPASGPPVALAVLLAMMLRARQEAGSWKATRLAFSGGLMFLAFAIPNLWHYLAIVSKASVNADIEATRAALLIRFSGSYLDAIAGLTTSFYRTYAGLRAALPILAVIASAWLLLRSNAIDNRKVKFLLWFGAILFILTGLLPVVENYLSNLAGRPPTQLDLIRSLRYLVPIMLLLVFCGISTLSLTRTARGLSLAAFGVFWLYAATAVSPAYPQSTPLVSGMRCWMKLRLFCEMKDDELLTVLTYVGTTPEGSLFFSPHYGLEIRSFGLRPLAFEWKDVGWLAYSNHKKLGQSLPKIQRYVDLQDREKGPELNARWLEFAREVGAKYVVLRGEAIVVDGYGIDYVVGDIVVYRSREDAS